MPTHAHRPTVSIRWILATCLSACVGTPTPEPPDNLPRPDDSKIFGPLQAREFVTAIDAVARDIPIVGDPRSVTPDTDVWVVNLDRAGPAVTTRAKLDGSFRIAVVGAPNDRVRIVSRTDTRHSLPLDAHVIDGNDGVAVAQLPPGGLPCLTISNDELSTVVSGKDVSSRFTLVSACSEPISISARLRFGDTGFAIDAPTSVPANGEASITVRITAHDDPREHADVVLLDVESGSRSGEYALGVWSVAASSLDDE
jgi:hypothetical protein